MRARPECIACYLKQATSAMNNAGINEERQIEVLYDLMKVIPTFDVSSSPAENTSYMLQHLSELLGDPDPFSDAKKEANLLAMELIKGVRDLMAESQSPLITAIKAAVAGNIVDLGILETYDLEGTLEECLVSDFAVWDFQDFMNLIEPGRRLLYIGDNTGEIAFDRLLVEELKKLGLSVTFVVKERPILNDATMEDAIQVGMDQVTEVITTGNGYLGVILEACSPEFLKALEEAHVVIAKGQANYESMEGSEEAGDKTFFILKMKCSLVAETVPGTKVGDMVFLRNRVRRSDSSL